MTNEERFEEAKQLYGNGHFGKAFPLLEALAKEGCAPAQCKLGESYYMGYGVSQDFAKAEEWWRKAAAQGDADAQLMLKQIIEPYNKQMKAYKERYAEAKELYAGRQFDKAFPLMEALAKEDYADAQCFLGFCYKKGGLGVSQDDDLAASWFRKAAEQGHAEALGNMSPLERRYMEARQYDCARQYDKAAPLYQALAEEGHAQAQCSLGYYHVYSVSIAGTYAEAVKWFRKAAEQGNEHAREWLGQIKAWEAPGNVQKKCPRCGADAANCAVNFSEGPHFITCPKCGSQFEICPKCGAFTQERDDGLYFRKTCSNCDYEDSQYVGSSEGPMRGDN